MIEKFHRRTREDNYARPATHWRVEPEIERLCAPEPELVRANTGEWPPLFLPKEWDAQRRAEFVLRWRAINAAGV